jgi:hypothetical protein
MKVKVGDVIICKTENSNNFTYGKPYTIISISRINTFSDIIRILDDKLTNYEVSSNMIQHMFSKINEWRDKQLKELGI